MPFADDLRDVNQIFEAAGYGEEINNGDDGPSIFESLSKDEKKAAKLMVKNMYIDFNSRNFDNPSIQQFYAGL